MRELYKNLLNEIDYEHLNQSDRTRNSRVLVIDGINSFIRSWTTTPTMNEDGDHTGGVVGTLRSIGYQIREFNPTRCIVVFDGKGGSDSRKKIYENYKSDRGKNRFRVNRQYADLMNEEEEHISMRRQFVWLNDILDYLPVQTMIYDSVEADDVISYITTELCDDEVVIVSTDKDFLQLVTDKVTVFSPTKKKLYNRNVVFEEFGIWPQNILLYRMLDGDKSDNITGIKGVGIKTLIKRFPEITNDTKLSEFDLFELCEKHKGEYKLYNDILDKKDTLLLNKKIMELNNSYIPNDIKLKIISRFNDNDIVFDKIKFIKVGNKYKVLSNWNNINEWLHTTFSNIIIN